jgi:hypothetical protein
MNLRLGLRNYVSGMKSCLGHSHALGPSRTQTSIPAASPHCCINARGSCAIPLQVCQAINKKRSSSGGKASKGSRLGFGGRARQRAADDKGTRGTVGLKGGRLSVKSLQDADEGEDELGYEADEEPAGNAHAAYQMYMDADYKPPRYTGPIEVANWPGSST